MDQCSSENDTDIGDVDRIIIVPRIQTISYGTYEVKCSSPSYRLITLEPNYPKDGQDNFLGRLLNHSLEPKVQLVSIVVLGLYYWLSNYPQTRSSIKHHEYQHGILALQRS